MQAQSGAHGLYRRRLSMKIEKTKRSPLGLSSSPLIPPRQAGVKQNLQDGLERITVK